jgi:hypothetical protein
MSKALTLADVIQALPAWIGALCAVAGLMTWQYQLHYKENYQLARRLLRAAYRYRDSINHARSPFSFGTASSDGEESSYKSREHKAWSNRFESINAAKRELLAELLEAEVVLGRKFTIKLKNLFECDKTLYGCILEHIDSIGDPPDIELNAKEARAARRKIMFAGLGYQDEFSLRVAHALEAFERELRPMLGRARSFRALRIARR